MGYLAQPAPGLAEPCCYSKCSPRTSRRAPRCACTESQCVNCLPSWIGLCSGLASSALSPASTSTLVALDRASFISPLNHPTSSLLLPSQSDTPLLYILPWLPVAFALSPSCSGPAPCTLISHVTPPLLQPTAWGIQPHHMTCPPCPGTWYIPFSLPAACSVFSIPAFTALALLLPLRVPLLQGSERSSPLNLPHYKCPRVTYCAFLLICSSRC